METEATRLMTAAKRGDPLAFERLVRDLRGWSVQVAMGLVGSPQDAQDLSQEAFLRTYAARDRYREDEPFLPWFHRILRNTCISFLRRRRRHASIFSADEDDRALHEPISDEAPVWARLARADLRSAVDRALRELAERDREILELRHRRELSYKEIAEELALPVGTVMSRLYHARRRLRVLLEDVAPDYDVVPSLEAGAALPTARQYARRRHPRTERTSPALAG
jgi:RNA polymerase sigma-70 factor (ECF subfamily)